MKVQPLLIWAQKWSLRFPCILLAKILAYILFQETPSELFGWMCCNVHCVNSYFSICLFSDTLILMLQVFIGIAVYGGYLWACKDPFIMQALSKIHR